LDQLIDTEKLTRHDWAEILEECFALSSLVGLMFPEEADVPVEADVLEDENTELLLTTRKK